MMLRRDSPTWFAPLHIRPKTFVAITTSLRRTPSDFAEHRLRLAGRVHICGIDEVHARIERVGHQGVHLTLRKAADDIENAARAAKRHRPQTERETNAPVLPSC
jgi:hypothetical protein